MRFCMPLLFLVFCVLGFAADVPHVIRYQGMFIDAATNKPVKGIVNRVLTFKIVEVSDQGVPSPTALMTRTISGVAIRDGVFNVDLEVPSTIDFTKSLAIVVSAGSDGETAGTQKLMPVPYSLGSYNSLHLGGKHFSQYSQAGHIHTSAGGKSFTIDGTGSALQPSDPQFRIINGAGSEVFRVNASGDLEKVARITATGLIETTQMLRVVNQASETVFSASNTGNVFVKGDLEVFGNSTLGSVVVSGAATLRRLTVEEKLIFGTNVQIDGTPGDSQVNVIGQSHTIESHASSPLFTKLQSLVSGAIVTSGFHSHSFAASDVTSDVIANNSVLSRHIKDGEIGNIKIASDAKISDTKLATISTPGKITTAALPVEVAFENASNTFGAGFGPSGKATLKTQNLFDALRSKNMQVMSTSSLAGAIFFEAHDLNKNFRWTLDGDGTLSFIRLDPGIGETKRIEIKTEGETTYVRLKKVVFEGDPNMITGSVIKNGTILAADLADGAIDSTKISVGAITTEKIRDASITSAKLANDSVTADKIKAGEIGTNAIADGSVTSAKIADGAVSNAKIADGAITTDKISDGVIYSSKIFDGSIKSEDIATGTIVASNIGDGQITSSKIADAQIKNEHLDPSVLTNRTLPISIDMGTSTSAHLTLQSSLNNPLFIKMITGLTTAANTPEPALILQNSATDNALKTLISLNHDGSMSMRSKDFTDPVTVDPKIFATMKGISAGAGNVCPIRAGYKVISFAESNMNGTGFCFDQKGQIGSYNEALYQCNSEGARLCSVSELRQACLADADQPVATTAILSQDLILNGAVLNAITFASNNANKCASSTDYTIGSIGMTSLVYYACCINP